MKNDYEHKKADIIAFIRQHDKRYEKIILLGLSLVELVMLKTQIELKLEKRKKTTEDR